MNVNVTTAIARTFVKMRSEHTDVSAKLVTDQRAMVITVKVRSDTLHVRYVGICHVRFLFWCFSKDIDECTEMSPCDETSMDCVNTMPSYRCDCKTGFEPMAGNSTACQRKSQFFMCLCFLLM